MTAQPMKNETEIETTSDAVKRSLTIDGKALWKAIAPHETLFNCEGVSGAVRFLQVENKNGVTAFTSVASVGALQTTVAATSDTGDFCITLNAPKLLGIVKSKAKEGGPIQLDIEIAEEGARRRLAVTVNEATSSFLFGHEEICLPENWKMPKTTPVRVSSIVMKQIIKTLAPITSHEITRSYLCGICMTCEDGLESRHVGLAWTATDGVRLRKSWTPHIKIPKAFPSATLLKNEVVKVLSSILNDSSFFTEAEIRATEDAVWIKLDNAVIHATNEGNQYPNTNAVIKGALDEAKLTVVADQTTMKTALRGLVSIGCKECRLTLNKKSVSVSNKKTDKGDEYEMLLPARVDGDIDDSINIGFNVHYLSEMVSVFHDHHEQTEFRLTGRMALFEDGDTIGVVMGLNI